MLITPIKPKAVTFQLPGTATSPGSRAATAPPRVRLPGSSQHHRAPQSPPPAPAVSQTPEPRSPQPDLIADIIHQPTTMHPSKIQKMAEQGQDANTKPTNQDRPATASSASRQFKAPERVMAMKAVVPGGGEKAEQKTKAKPEKRGVSKTKTTKAYRALADASTVRPTGRKFSHSSTTTSQVRKMVFQAREQTNVSSHDHVRWMKHDMAVLREHLVKMEEEIKLANKAKVLLDTKIFDLRKCLSVNQQSVSSQQKKSHRQDGVLKKLREETHVLTRGKRRLEQHLLQVKSHNWTLDNMRKTMKSKIAILGRALELDAQNLKLYRGPVVTRKDSISKQRHYSNECPLPDNTRGDEAIAQLCSKAMEVVTASKNLRAEMKSMIQTIYSNKTEAHHKIASATTDAMTEAKSRQSQLVLQKGQVRMQTNSLAHQRHVEEISLGLALGPKCDLHKSVSEKVDRPLSQLRPCSAMVESKAYKGMTSKIRRQLSASAIEASRMASADSSLGRRIKVDTRDKRIDLQMLHRRSASLHKR